MTDQIEMAELHGQPVLKLQTPDGAVALVPAEHVFAAQHGLHTVLGLLGVDAGLGVGGHAAGAGSGQAPEPVRQRCGPGQPRMVLPWDGLHNHR